MELWLDGRKLVGVQSWGLIEELQEPSRMTVTLLVGDIVWGAPPPPAPAAFVDDGGQHFTSTFPGGRVTPSGKNACVRCGEAWPCSTAMHRFNTHGSYAPPEVDKDSGAPLS